MKPKLRFQLTDPAQPYDSTTGERVGSFAVGGSTFEHYIFLPENKTERVKFLNDLLKNSPGTTPEGVAYERTFLTDKQLQIIVIPAHMAKISVGKCFVN